MKNTPCGDNERAEAPEYEDTAQGHCGRNPRKCCALIRGADDEAPKSRSDHKTERDTELHLAAMHGPDSCHLPFEADVFVLAHVLLLFRVRSNEE